MADHTNPSDKQASASWTPVPDAASSQQQTVRDLIEQNARPAWSLASPEQNVWGSPDASSTNHGKNKGVDKDIIGSSPMVEEEDNNHSKGDTSTDKDSHDGSKYAQSSIFERRASSPSLSMTSRSKGASASVEDAESVFGNKKMVIHGEDVAADDDDDDDLIMHPGPSTPWASRHDKDLVGIGSSFEPVKKTSRIDDVALTPQPATANNKQLDAHDVFANGVDHVMKNSQLKTPAEPPLSSSSATAPNHMEPRWTTLEEQRFQPRPASAPVADPQDPYRPPSRTDTWNSDDSIMQAKKALNPTTESVELTPRVMVIVGADVIALLAVCVLLVLTVLGGAVIPWAQLGSFGDPGSETPMIPFGFIPDEGISSVYVFRCQRIMWLFCWAMLVVLTMSITMQRALQIIGWFDYKTAPMFACLRKGPRARSRAMWILWGEAIVAINACASYWIFNNALRQRDDVNPDYILGDAFTGGDILYLILVTILGARLTLKAALHIMYNRKDSNAGQKTYTDQAPVVRGYEGAQSDAVLRLWQQIDALKQKPHDSGDMAEQGLMHGDAGSTAAPPSRNDDNRSQMLALPVSSRPDHGPSGDFADQPGRQDPRPSFHEPAEDGNPRARRMDSMTSILERHKATRRGDEDARGLIGEAAPVDGFSFYQDRERRA